jgi:hypothetical protein
MIQEELMNSGVMVLLIVLSVFGTAALLTGVIALGTWIGKKLGG